MNDSGEVLPGLARSWDILRRRHGLTPSIWPKASPSMTGASFSAEDVKFSLDRARAEDSTNPQKALFAAIENVEGDRRHHRGGDAFGSAGAISPCLTWPGVRQRSFPRPRQRPIRKTPVGTGPFKFRQLGARLGPSR